ncbi:hypothetical protein [Saccharopolyspora hattusasensis]|uniref:hypothetical protein n=1 Tax=Saccharopolyspora hattusasensis TaxID=1128679 RepID=UPI003D95DAD4
MASPLAVIADSSRASSLSGVKTRAASAARCAVAASPLLYAQIATYSADSASSGESSVGVAPLRWALWT